SLLYGIAPSLHRLGRETPPCPTGVTETAAGAGVVPDSSQGRRSPMPLDMTYKSVNRFEHIIVHTDLDKGVWVPLYPGSWFQPLLFGCPKGGFAHLLKVNPGKMLAHYHPSIVHGYTIQGQWRYLENDWVARPGTYIHESAGEVHTLCVDPPVPMI